jgi:hypothetical protein
MTSTPLVLGHTVEFDLFPGRTLHVMLFRGVRNAAALHGKVAAQDLDAALLNGRMVVGSLHLLAAANKALVAQSSKMFTRSLHQELVYCLSGSRNIAEGARIFGLNGGSGTDAPDLVLACRFDAGDAAAAEREMAAAVEGTPVNLGGGRGAAAGAGGAGLSLLDAPEALLAEARAEAEAGRGPPLAKDGELEFGSDEHLRKVFKLGSGEKEVAAGAAGRAQLVDAVVLRLATKEC